jgi:hypothetical protein
MEAEQECQTCGGIYEKSFNYDCSGYACGKCPICMPCRCYFRRKFALAKKCDKCSHIINPLLCPCAMCAVEYNEHPNGRHCEYCFPPIDIKGLNRTCCLDTIESIKKELDYCQQCHKFTWSIPKGREIYHTYDPCFKHLKIKNPKTVAQLFKQEHPEYNR